MEGKYSYLPCESCSSKKHCEQCGRDIREAVLALPGVEDVTVDVKRRYLPIRAPELDPDGLLDALDRLGVFI